jgi:hypothetical protein
MSFELWFVQYKMCVISPPKKRPAWSPSYPEMARGCATGSCVP